MLCGPSMGRVPIRFHSERYTPSRLSVKGISITVIALHLCVTLRMLPGGRNPDSRKRRHPEHRHVLNSTGAAIIGAYSVMA